jgi:hypothetical protein
MNSVKTALHEFEPAVRAGDDRGGGLPADHARAQPGGGGGVVRQRADVAAGRVPADERVAAQGGARRHHRRRRLPAHEHLDAARHLRQPESTGGAAADAGRRRRRQPAVPRAARPQEIGGALQRLPLGTRLAQPLARRATHPPLPQRQQCACVADTF